MRQAEFEFPPALAAPRRAEPARAATGVLTDRSRRRPAAPQSARLEICPEAFAEPGKPGGAPGTTVPASAFEAVAALLATIVFGLGWAALELHFELQQEHPLGVRHLRPELAAEIGWEVARGNLSESRYDRAAVGAWELAAANPDPTGGVAGELRGSESRGNDRWIEGAQTEPVAGRSNR